MRLFLAFVASVSAVSHTIDVGKSGLTFTPDSVTAAVGDTLEFRFVGGFHDAVTSDYATPCQPATKGVKFASTQVQGSATAPKTFKVNVTTTDPTYYYCSVGQHCSNGMVAAINPSADKTVAALKTAAKGKAAKAPTGAPFGGIP